MKTLYFFLIALITSVPFATAQKIRYTDTSNKWTLTMDDGWNVSTSTLGYLGDTFVNGYTYFLQPSFNFTAFFGVREDTLAGKVFYLESPDSTEKLLFDYTLAIGDTFSTYGPYNIWQPAVFVLAYVDTCMINNFPHIVQHFNCIDQSMVWQDHTFVIEGLGCIEEARMLMPPHVNPGSYITCFENKGSHPTIVPTQQFLNNTTSCIPLAVKERKFEKLSARVVPNPADNNASLEWGKIIGHGSLVISNVVGQRMVEMDIRVKDRVSFTELGLVPGVYFYRLNDMGSKEVCTGKFVFE